MAGVRLIDLQTDLKSLRYGNDKPYVTKDINNPPTSNQTGMQINKRVDDLSRIAQMLVDRPGLKFIGNQALLQQTDTVEKLQKASSKGLKALGREALNIAKNTVIGTAKILGSTLAQVPVNGTGTHFVYGFRTDTYLSPATTNSFTQFFGKGGVEGAQYALKGEPVPIGRLETTPEGTQLTETTAIPNQLGQLHIGIKGDITPLEPPVIKPFREEDQKKKAKNSTKDNILNALTGSAITLKSGARETTAAVEGSRSNKDVTYDIPETSTKNVGSKPYSSGDTYTGTSTQDTINAAIGGNTIPTNKLSGSYRPSDPNPAANTQASYQPFGNPVPISEISEKDETKEPTTGIYDFRKKQGKSYSFDYNSPTINRESRVNLGNQGKKSFDRSKYSNTDPDTVDGINALPEQTGERAPGAEGGRDFAKFYFEIITPDQRQFLHFRAFIDSIDDSYNADWQGFNYVGRGEKFYTYGGFERDINISFKIAAATRSEMKPLYRKMVLLASSTAPTYGGQGFMRGTLARMTVGSYFSQLPGVITSVKYSLIQDMPWELSMQSPEQGGDSDVQELPMGLQCNVSFKVIHDFAPQTGLYHYITNPNPEKAQDFLK